MLAGQARLAAESMQARHEAINDVLPDAQDEHSGDTRGEHVETVIPGT
jgi:hypothetical protein